MAVATFPCAPRSTPSICLSIYGGPGEIANGPRHNDTPPQNRRFPFAIFFSRSAVNHRRTHAHHRARWFTFFFFLNFRTLSQVPKRKCHFVLISLAHKTGGGKESSMQRAWLAVRMWQSNWVARALTCLKLSCQSLQVRIEWRGVACVPFDRT